MDGNNRTKYSRSNRRLENEAAAGQRKKYVQPEMVKRADAKKNLAPVSRYDSDYKFNRQAPERLEKSFSARKIESEIEEIQGGRRRFRRFEESYYERPEGESQAAAYFLFFILSLLLSVTYYSFPFIDRLATGSTAVNLYSGFAMHQGLTPYLEIYGNAGPLFYILNQLGTSFNSTFILWILEILFVWFSGIMIFKVLSGILTNRKLIVISTAFMIFVIGGMSLGGNQPIVFALPFAFHGFLVLNRYFIDDTAASDENFILFGVSGAFASLFFPFFLILWAAGALGLIGRNFALKNFGRGFYQILSGLFGAVLVYAFVGYYTLISQIFYPTIEQSIILPFTNLNFSLSGLKNLVFSLVLIFLFGLFSNFIFGYHRTKRGNHQTWSKTLVGLGAFSLLFTSLINGASPSNALVVLPFVLSFLSLNLERELEQEDEYEFYSSEIFSLFLKKMLYLPILALIFTLLFPFANQMMNGERFASEQRAASYLKEKSDDSESVTVISEEPTINSLSNRYSMVNYPPSYYPISYSQSFNISLVSAKIEFIVLDERVDLEGSTAGVLAKYYKEVPNFSDAHYKIYKIK